MVSIKQEKSPAENEALNKKYVFNNSKKIVPYQALNDALSLCKRGFSVILANGKHPLSSWKDNQYQRKTEDDLIDDFKGKPYANIGIVTGKISGIFVLDIDGVDGEESLTKLESQYGQLASSVEVITGGGGRHIYFKYPDNMEIGNSVSKIANNLDIRGEGGVVICPPSIHPSGRSYEWSVDCAQDISEAPQWLLNLVKSEQKQVGQEKRNADWSSIIAGVCEGQRNDCLARLVGKLLGHRLDPELTLHIVSAWNDARCKPPLSHDEVYKTFVSIAQMEAKKRGVAS
ncbi:MAG: bifunctional DNA primase/polymerase [Pseudomonadota bacterium]